MRLASHPSIIHFYGVTKFKDEKKYSLVLEYADSGTLEKYLRATSIEWEIQLKFAKEIAGAILWLHDNNIIHGDLHPKNILIHQNTIKLADFGCSRLQGTECHFEPRGIIPYTDPKILNAKSDLTKKSDIYSLGVVFWELTSRSPPFGFESDLDQNQIMQITLGIVNGKRETPIPNTNSKFITLYEKCWQYEPQKRPDISEVTSELNKIHPIDAENNNNSSSSKPNESKIMEQPENECFESSSFEDCHSKEDFDSLEDCDINLYYES
ncbi:hypothetical protein RclHR1_00460028 [Rhizophagus clarus]|nr:hypothetical protein RclHR1_00460028 [Rhizophagus clarus]